MLRHLLCRTAGPIEAYSGMSEKGIESWAAGMALFRLN